MSRECRRFGCDYEIKEDGRVPVHGSWYTGMPQKPDGSVQMLRKICRRCGHSIRYEEPHSWRRNA